ncbi:hypothetical protein D9M72_438250 [compost metagenome]
MDFILGCPAGLEQVLQAGRQGEVAEQGCVARIGPGRPWCEAQELGRLVVVHHHPALGIDQDHPLADGVQDGLVVREQLGELLGTPAPRDIAQVPAQQPGRHRAPHQEGKGNGQQGRQAA